MIGKLKQLVREYLTDKYNAVYEAELEEQTISYHQWIYGKEASGNGEKTDGGITEEAFGKEPENREEILIIKEEDAELSEAAISHIRTAFTNNPEIQVIYGDEDEINSNGTVRMNPWFKPDYSPDTLLSYFYYGSLVAVRREVLEESVYTMGQNESLFKHLQMEYEISETQPKTKLAYITMGDNRKTIYELLLRISLPLHRSQVLHLHEILTTSHNITYWGYEEEYNDIKEACKTLRSMKPIDGVSVILPSKDNPEVLGRALASVKHWTKDISYEIIVVDNGSNAANKEAVERLQKTYNFKYLYRPMEFNFSKMCNWGAENSSYEYFLFLNDDCEVRSSKWLSHMAKLAAVETTGAVGAKLYYPNSKRIQHCGIYNIHVGPVHKLQFKEDVRPYYDRRNKGTRNVLAVTAACLMVRKSVFEEAGGFDEELQVAFNDVDLCYRLYEKGYHNVADNEIHLWHHESLSRGSDESPEKLARLMAEKQKLYDRHPALWERDPYYHEGFSTDILDTSFSFDYEYSHHKPLAMEVPEVMKGLPAGVKEDPCVAPMVEYAGDLQGWFMDSGLVGRIEERLGTKQTAYLQGNAVVLGSDNACFEKFIILRHEESGSFYSIKPEWYYRPDVENNLKDQVNVALSGFACFVNLEAMPKGRYEIALMARDKISKNHYLRITTRSIERK